MKEIERKLLVTDNSYHTLAYAKDDILQGYICSGHGHTVRVRTRGDKGYLTIKGPSLDGGISRFEWEKEITLDDARQLFTLCGERIEKTRYLVKNGKHVVEVDEFHGENEGLVFAEIELSSVDEGYILPPLPRPRSHRRQALLQRLHHPPPLPHVEGRDRLIIDLSRAGVGVAQKKHYLCNLFLGINIRQTPSL